MLKSIAKQLSTFYLRRVGQFGIIKVKIWAQFKRCNLHEAVGFAYINKINYHVLSVEPFTDNTKMLVFHYSHPPWVFW